MDFAESIINYFLSEKFWISLIIAVCTFAVWEVIKKSVLKLLNTKYPDKKLINRNHIIIRIARVIIFFCATVIVLQVNEINVTSLVAGIGVAGIVIGFALQDILKDFIMGIGIAADNFYSVGDVVEYGGAKECEVIGFNLRSTKLYDVNTGNIISVCNRNISEIKKISDWLDICVPASYDVKPEIMRNVCKEISERTKKVDGVKKSVFLGTDEFAESLINYRIRLFCNPKNKEQTKREVFGIIQDVYLENNLSVPFNQLDIHNK